MYKMDPSDFTFLSNEQYLATPRYGHRTVISENTIIHVGGDGRKQIETWTKKNDGFEIFETEATTNRWLEYGEVFVL